ncbi:MAG: hypothetical protein JKY01_04570 [Pseudomonadales bacterium]|nr:hypothetical protein [Pseudomonadales bacterium]
MLRIFLLTSLILFTGCASAPSWPPKENAIIYGLSHDATMRRVMDYCSEAQPALKNKAWEAKKNWWQRNGLFIEAADYGFSYNLLTLNGDRQETNARYAMALALEVEKTANSRAKIVTTSQGAAACTKIIAEYNEGSRDLDKSSEFHPILTALYQAKKTHGDDLLLKQARVAKVSGKRFSRSSITAERLVKRTVCPRAIVKTLRSNWPTEIFEATCPDKSYSLISCEWGNCKVR